MSTSNTTPPPAVSCGGGVIGNGQCENSTECCSRWGWCDTNILHCAANNCVGGPCLPGNSTTSTTSSATTGSASQVPTTSSNSSNNHTPFSIFMNSDSTLTTPAILAIIGCAVMILALFVALIACCFACGKRRREKKPEISTPVESSFVHKKTNSDFYGMYVVSGPSDSPPSVSGNSTISSKNHSEEIKGDFHASDGGGAARGDLSYSMQDYQNATAASLPGIASTQPIVYNGNVEKYADTASWVAEHSSSPAMAAATAGMMMKHESGASTIVDTPAPMSDSASLPTEILILDDTELAAAHSNSKNSDTSRQHQQQAPSPSSLLLNPTLGYSSTIKSNTTSEASYDMTRWNKRFENLYTSLSRTPSNAASSSGIRPPLRQAESNTQPPQIPLSENKPNLIRRKSHSQIMMDA